MIGAAVGGAHVASVGWDAALASGKSQGQCSQHNMPLGAPSCVGYLGKTPSAGE